MRTFCLALFAPLTTLKNNGHNWSYHNSAEKWGEAMSKTNVRIGAFEIDDAELHGEHQGERTLSIPCKSDPDLCMQLDAWDADTSVPAILNGEHSVLYRKHYDRQSDAWVMRLA
ncbi:Protein of uncharacterised function (DUF1480) [Klebsiella pneumoniae]|nr:Protein of uncharacterised function (DUF1480) [Klebsiella pneumoniae]VGA16950.1 Protein of uncharacterised function (DUF1480) [Klebsiella pneumoniae]